jgi:hypothetical protein
VKTGRPKQAPATGQSASGLAKQDLKELARLVRKYGRSRIIAVAKNVSPSKLGRPTRGLLPYFEQIHLAQTIDEWAEEHRSRGSRKPITDAENELYEMSVEEELKKQPGHYVKWQKNIKKKRLEGRRQAQRLRSKFEGPLRRK